MTAKIPPALFDAFCVVGRDLFVQGLNSSHSGNLSALRGDTLWITRRGACLGRLGPSDIIPLSPADYHTFGPIASRELPVHEHIYHIARTRAVVHAHPPAVIALSFSRSSIEPMDLEGAHYLSRVDIVPTRKGYNPQEMAATIARILVQAKVVVVQGHGIFSCGQSLFEALHWASALEQACRILLLSRLA